MSAEDRLLWVVAVVAGVLALAGFSALVIFGYLACFTSGHQSDHYFNAATFSVLPTCAFGILAAMAGVGASS